MATTLFLDTFTGGAGVLQGHAPDTVPDAATWGATTGPLGCRSQNLNGSGLTIPDSSGGTGVGTARVVFSTTGISTATGFKITFSPSIDAGKVTGDVVRMLAEGDNSLPGSPTTLVWMSLEVDAFNVVNLTSYVVDNTSVQYDFANVVISGSSPVIEIQVNALDAKLYINSVLVESLALGAATFTYITGVGVGSYYSAPAGPSGITSIQIQTGVGGAEPNLGWSSGAGGSGSTVYGGAHDMAQLIPYSRFKGFTDTNEPLVGGKVYTYEPGTSTPKDTYQDHLLGSANTNPIILDAFGEATIFIDGDTDLVLTDPDETVRWGPIRHGDTSLNATLVDTALAGDLTITSTAVSWTGPPTHSGNHTWSGTQTFNGNVVIGDLSTDTLTIAPNAVTWSNNPTHSGNHTFSGNIAVTGTQAFTGNTTLTTWAGTTSGSVKLSATGVPYATSAHNNAGAVTGTTNQYYCSGTYTPTVSDSANTSARAGITGSWVRVANVVTVSAYITVDPTAADTATQVLVSLPPVMGASNFVGTNLVGVATCSLGGTDANLPSVGVVGTVNGAQTVYMAFTTGTDVGNAGWALHFTFTIP